MKENAVVLSKIKKTYKNGVEALKEIDLKVKKGDFYALLGPNGAGKSTTIGILTSLVVKTSGKVTILGHDLDSEPVNAKKLLGLVPQEFNFNPFEKVEQILINQAGYYGITRKEAIPRAEILLKQLGLFDKKDSAARYLSGGMKRRLMIARALMHDPEVLILDEPTAGVDIELRRSMWDFLRELNQKGKTIILTTHYLEEAEMLCRHIGIIFRGKLIENTSMKALLNTLQSERIILDLAENNEKTISLENYTFEQPDLRTLEVEINRKIGLNDLFLQLSAQNIHVESMRNKSNRLEELFLHLVNENINEENH